MGFKNLERDKVYKFCQEHEIFLQKINSGEWVVCLSKVEH